MWFVEFLGRLLECYGNVLLREMVVEGVKNFGIEFGV